MEEKMETNELTSLIIECAITVHKNLGPGLLENTYQECLAYELIQKGLKVEKEKSLPLIYKDIKLECGYRIDLLVEDEIIIEVKSVERFTDVFFAQILTYLKLYNRKYGLLINFNVSLVKNGIKRFVNKYYEE